MSDALQTGAAVKKSSHAVLLFFIAAAILFGLGISPHWRMGSDSSRYLMMSRQLVQGNGYEFAGHPQWSIPPAVPLYYAAVFKLSGFEPTLSNLTDGFTIPNAACVFLGYLGLVAAYLFVREVSSRRNALLVTLLIAVSRFYYGSMIEPLSDVPYSAASWAALFFLARAVKRGSWRYFAGAAFFTALAILTRVVGGTLLAAGVVYFAWRLVRGGRNRSTAIRGLAAMAPAAAVAVCLAAMIWTARGSGAFNYYDQLIAGRSVLWHVGRMLFDAVMTPRELFEAFVGMESAAGLWIIPFGLLAVGFVRLSRRAWSPALLYVLFYFAFVVLTQKMLPRYVFPLFPVLYLCILEGLDCVFEFARARGRGGVKLEGWVRWSLLVAVLACNLTYDVREIAMGFSGDDFYREHRHGKWADYIELAPGLGEKVGDGRLMAYWWCAVYMLGDVETVGVPHVPAHIQDSRALVADYAAEERVVAVILDPKYGDDGGALADFVTAEPSTFHLEAVAGRLKLYRRPQSPQVSPR